jgi:hypothetical protein
MRKYTVITHEYLGFGSAYFIGMKRIRTKDLRAWIKKNPDTHLVFVGWPKELLSSGVMRENKVAA